MWHVSDEITSVGWVGLGDQGAPMARAVAGAGYQLHVWVRRESALQALDGVDHIVHQNLSGLAEACNAIALCLREDSDIQSVLEVGGLWRSLQPSSVLINHATGLPKFARELAARGLERRVDVLDAPVSGGHVGAVEKTLTTIVGGGQSVADRLSPVFTSFSKRVFYMGPAGSGQIGKLINNALLMMNQANVQDVLRLAG